MAREPTLDFLPICRRLPRGHVDAQSEELFEHHRLVADPGQTPLRVDKFIINLVAHFKQTPDGGLSVRPGQWRTCQQTQGQAGDVVTVTSQPVFEFELLLEPMDWNILYEDDDLLGDQQAHEFGGASRPWVSGTLVNGILHHFQNMPSLPNQPSCGPDWFIVWTKTLRD